MHDALQTHIHTHINDNPYTIRHMYTLNFTRETSYFRIPLRKFTDENSNVSFHCSDKRDIRSLSFELSQMSPKVGLAVPPMFTDHGVYSNITDER